MTQDSTTWGSSLKAGDAGETAHGLAQDSSLKTGDTEEFSRCIPIDEIVKSEKRIVKKEKRLQPVNRLLTSFSTKLKGSNSAIFS